MKILIITNAEGDTRDLYKVDDRLLEQIRSVDNEVTVEAVNDLDKNLDQKISETDVLISTDMSVLTSENSKNLKWLHLTSAGTNKLPGFLQNSDILITNSSGVHPVPISEHVFGLMLMLSRSLHKAHRVQIEQKKWRRSYDYYLPSEIFGKQLLIVGIGRIGERIAEIGKAFGMEVSGVVRNPEKKRKTNVRLFKLKDLTKAVKSADFVVNCLPGTQQTKGLFNFTRLKEFKSESYFINIGRGTTVVENDLITALEEGIIKGAGLDVFETEPLPETSPLWNLENVIITPHYAGWTPKYTERVINIFTENLKAYLKKEPLPNLVHKDLGY